MTRYPVSEHMRSQLRTPRGTAFDDVTLEAVLAGRISMEDLRVTPEALLLQAEIAGSAGRAQLAENLRRAAELATVPDDLILTIYAALRPGRATADQLRALAGTLEREHHAPLCAALVREAASHQ